MIDFAQCWYSSNCLHAFIFIDIIDNQFVPINEVSNAPLNLNFYDSILRYSYLNLYCTYTVNITHNKYYSDNA